MEGNEAKGGDVMSRTDRQTVGLRVASLEDNEVFDRVKPVWPHFTKN